MGIVYSEKARLLALKAKAVALKMGSPTISFDVFLAVLAAEDASASGPGGDKAVDQRLLDLAGSITSSDIELAKSASPLVFEPVLQSFLDNLGSDAAIDLAKALGWRAGLPSADDGGAPADQGPAGASRRAPTSGFPDLDSIREMEAALGRKVVGQDGAISALVQGFYLGRFRHEVGAPAQSFIFFGDSGVGKSSLAREFGALTAERFGNEYSFISIDMPTYTGKEGVMRLLGSLKIYSGSEQGTLTSHILRHPKAVVLLDEFDRSDSEVLNALLSFLDSGKVVDPNTGAEVDCSGAIYLFTTNKGSALYLDEKAYGFLDARALPQEVVKDALRKDMSPVAYAFLDRIGRFCLFRSLGADDLAAICAAEIAKWLKCWKAAGLEIEIEDEGDLVSLLLLRQGRVASARFLKAGVEDFFGTTIARAQLDLREGSVSRARVRIAPESSKHLDISPRDSSFILVDDKPDAFVRASERRLLDATGIEASCVPARTMAETEAALREQAGRAAFLLLDLNMSEGDPSGDLDFGEALEPRFRSSFEILARVREKWPELPVFIFSGLDLDQYPRLCSYFLMAGGASGIVRKGGAASDWEAVGAAMRQAAWKKALRERTKGGRRLEFSPVTTLVGEGALEIAIADVEFRQRPFAEDMGFFSMEVPDASFRDLVGVDDARDRLREALAFLKDPASFLAEGVTVPAGYMLYGPPGTGKTSVAKALANESEALFINCSIGKLSSKWVGESEGRVRELFDVARRNAPVVVFIDELDALGDRGEESSPHDRKVINEFLQCLDGFSKNEGVIFLAATNRLESIDDALLRPGRFGQKILVDIPRKREDREKLVALVLGKRKAGSADDIAKAAARLADWTSGLSPAQIEGIVVEALAIARRRRVASGEPPPPSARIPSMEDFTEARNALVFGAAAEAGDPESTRVVAVHEAGHALMRHACGKRVLQVTIVGRGDAGGFVEPGEDKGLASRASILQRIDVLLGGRCAEELELGADGATTGASQDLVQASALASAYLFRWGFSSEGELASLGSTPTDELLKDRETRARVNALLSERKAVVEETLKRERARLFRLRDELLAKETLLGDQVAALLES